MERRQQALLLQTVLDNPWIPKVPFLKQRHFLVEPREEVLYGGAGGGGARLC